MWRHLFNRWILLAIVLLAFPAWLWTPPILRAASDKFAAINGADPLVFDGSADPTGARRVVANPAHPVFLVSEPQLAGRDQASSPQVPGQSMARMSARLSAFGAPTEYPSLLVTTYGADNKPRRSVRLAPAEYEHGTSPASSGQSETIQFGIPTVPQDAGFAVQAVNTELLVWRPAEAARP